MSDLTESEVEEAALSWLAGLGWSIKHGPEIAPGKLLVERRDYADVVLGDRVRQALARLNPTLPAEALDATASFPAVGNQATAVEAFRSVALKPSSAFFMAADNASRPAS